MPDSSDSLHSKLLRAARRVLRPLVKLMLRNGISAVVFQEIARKEFVDAAFEEFPPASGKQTLANVSVLTGLNRKEVSRLVKLAGVVDDDKANWTRCGKVIDGWLTDKEFQSAAGFPLDLAFSGPSPNFTDLVKKYSGDMYPTPVKTELVRVGAVVEDDGKLRMSKRGYVPGKDQGSLVDIYGVDTAELMETLDNNLQNATDPLLQYKVLADNLPEEHLQAFNDFSKRVSLNAIDEIRRWLIEHDNGGEPSAEGKRYFAGVGVYQINRLRPNEDQDGEASHDKEN